MLSLTGYVMQHSLLIGTMTLMQAICHLLLADVYPARQQQKRAVVFYECAWIKRLWE